MKLMILGATGLVGRHVLKNALDDARIQSVIAPTRRSLSPHPKLVNPVAPELGGLLPSAADWCVDAIICAIGTTIGNAGSKAAFRHVDYELPIAFAKLAHQQGTTVFALVSSPGASLSIPLFYCRTKGELERDMQGIGFKSLTIIRPGMIGGEREEFRLAERLVFPLAKILRPLLPKGLWINPAADIANVLLDSIITPNIGLHMITSKDIIKRMA